MGRRVNLGGSDDTVVVVSMCCRNVAVVVVAHGDEGESMVNVTFE